MLRRSFLIFPSKNFSSSKERKKISSSNNNNNNNKGINPAKTLIALLLLAWSVGWLNRFSFFSFVLATNNNHTQLRRDDDNISSSSADLTECNFFGEKNRKKINNV